MSLKFTDMMVVFTCSASHSGPIDPFKRLLPRRSSARRAFNLMYLMMALKSTSPPGPVTTERVPREFSGCGGGGGRGGGGAILPLDGMGELELPSSPLRPSALSLLMTRSVMSSFSCRCSMRSFRMRWSSSSSRSVFFSALFSFESAKESLISTSSSASCASRRISRTAVSCFSALVSAAFILASPSWRWGPLIDFDPFIDLRFFCSNAANESNKSTEALSPPCSFTSVRRRFNTSSSPMPPGDFSELPPSSFTWSDGSFFFLIAAFAAKFNVLTAS
mmetsp:Transcript_29451/g.74116  ORF Transcript_29451/g.74116 Transcript_29451/m.74116 type:complete len:277 (+) Transcript_29451:1853-2683(+)